MKLQRDLGIAQMTAWHLLHLICEGLFPEILPVFGGSVEVDESYIDGLERNKHEDKKLNTGRGTIGKNAVLGVTGLKMNQIQATTKPKIQQFVNDIRSQDAFVFTDEHFGYEGVVNHISVNHSQKQWMVSTTFGELAHKNRIRLFWATSGRAYHETYHPIGRKCLNRYIAQFTGKRNMRPLDTMAQIQHVVTGLVRRKILSGELVA